MTSKAAVRKMTRDELRKEAKKLGIPGRGKMLKSQLLLAVLAALSKNKPAKKPRITVKKKKNPELVNHVALVVDTSGSMSHLTRMTVEVCNDQLRNLREQSRKTGQKTTVTFITFNDYPHVRYTRRPVEEARDITLSDVRTSGCTALYDATDDAASRLGAAPDANKKTTSFLALVITDGHENSSRRVRAHQLRNSIQQAQATDRWTYAFLLPANPQTFARKLGIPEGNCTVWTQTEVGFEEASVLTSQSMSNYYSARSRGATRSKNFFTTDLSKVSKSKMRKKLHDLSPRVREATIDERIEVRDFCMKRFGEYRLGAAFYLLMKAETIQNYKQILVMEKNGSQIYGGQEARDLLKLPSYNVRVHPGDHGEFEVFVQSTSVNRKVVPGTKLLYCNDFAKK